MQYWATTAVIDTMADNDVDFDSVGSVSESTSTSKIELMDVKEEPGTYAASHSSTSHSKKHKHSTRDAFETALGSVLNKLLEAQNESEPKFEEKRMKMEEAKRIQERELMQAEKKEQRLFHSALMQMLSLVTQGNNTSTPSPLYPPPFPLYQPFDENEQ